MNIEKAELKELFDARVKVIAELEKAYPRAYTPAHLSAIHRLFKFVSIPDFEATVRKHFEQSRGLAPTAAQLYDTYTAMKEREYQDRKYEERRRRFAEQERKGVTLEQLPEDLKADFNGLMEKLGKKGPTDGSA